MITNANVDGCRDLFKNGSRVVRADFHLHTRADKEFDYRGEENEFCKAYVQRLVDEQISIGVVTNHNKFDFGEFKTLRKRAKKQNILLLPGVELSVRDGANGIHTLVVFSDEWWSDGIDHITHAINAAFSGVAPQDFQNNNKRTKNDLVDSIQLFEDWQKDFFLVFAHVQQNNGLWHEIKGGRFSELAEEYAFKQRTLGFQKVPAGERGNSKRQDVKKWLEDWYPAEVEGSDCKSLDDIGKGTPCYLQLGELTYDAVKYALVDHENRVHQLPVEIRHSHILSASFEGGALQPFPWGLNQLASSGDAGIFPGSTTQDR